MPANDNTHISNRVNNNMQRNAPPYAVQPGNMPAYAASNRATRLPIQFNPREMRSGQKKSRARRL
jgi:hypothetical protein